MYFFICVTCCVVPVLICAIAASAAVPHLGPAVPLCGSAVAMERQYHTQLSQLSCYAWTIICIMFIYLSQCAAPHRSMNVGGAPSLSLKCESWLLMPIWEFNSPFTHLGGGSTSMAQKSQLYFISFVSSNWVVINRQKGGDWKCNQALIVGFDDNDHAIRGLMRFIEMTSREL